MRFQNSIWKEYHNSSKNIEKGHANIPFDSELWSDAWKTVQYKKYHRLKEVSLPEPMQINAALSGVFNSRSSVRNYCGLPIQLSKISTLLYWSCGKKENDTRMYPSGGGMYPIEVYILNSANSKELAAGIYHYDVKNHALRMLVERSFTKTELGKMFGYPWAQKASVTILLSVVFDRTIQKYGERGYRITVLEAGHIMQNFHLVAHAIELSSCCLAGMREFFLEKIMNFDSNKESLLYAIAIDDTYE